MLKRRQLCIPLPTELTWSHPINSSDASMSQQHNCRLSILRQSKGQNGNKHKIRVCAIWHEIHTVRGISSTPGNLRETKHISAICCTSTCKRTSMKMNGWHFQVRGKGEHIFMRPNQVDYFRLCKSHPIPLWLVYRVVYRTLYFWAGCQQYPRVSLSPTLTVSNS